VNQPKFTFWPWGTLAAAVPIMAFGCSVIAASQKGVNPEESLIVFFSVLAAGNGYLFAMAVGDFGRSIVAMPAGAIAGFIAVKIFAFPILTMLFLFPLIVIALFSLTLQQRIVSGCLVMLALGISTLVIATVIAAKANPAFATVCAYPFTCGAITATMPLKSDLEGYWQAWYAGTRAALFGMAPGIAGLAFGAMILDPVIGSFRPLTSAQFETVLLIIPVGMGLLVANYFCVRELFASVFRAGVSSDTYSGEESAFTPDSDESPLL